MLEDDTLIESLKNSKKTSEEVEQRMKDAKLTEERINTMRTNYTPVAELASALYFSIIQLEK